MTMPHGSPLSDPINWALINLIARDDWFGLVERYIGS